MFELTIAQDIINRAYELKEKPTYRPSSCCPMPLQMCKYLGLEEGEYEWGYCYGYKGDVLHHRSVQAEKLVVQPFDSGRKLTSPITIDVEEVTQ